MCANHKIATERRIRPSGSLRRQEGLHGKWSRLTGASADRLPVSTGERSGPVVIRGPDGFAKTGSWPESTG